jgi:hypothetical protein
MSTQRGRTTSSAPNLQNIDKAEKLRKAQAEAKATGQRVALCFYPALFGGSDSTKWVYPDGTAKVEKD